MNFCSEEERLNAPLRDIISECPAFNELLPFDEYHLVMAQTDVLEGIHEKPAVKLAFYRTPPFGASYVIGAGISAFLAKLNSFSYRRIVPYLKEKGYRREFIEYAESRDKIIADVYSVPENSVVFPLEPIIILETNLIDARLLEGIVLSEINFATLAATKWHRIKNAALKCPIMEFGRRRAQNALKASLYSYMAGIGATSNCEANAIFGIPSSGTMGHEYVQSFLSEYDAFDRWLKHNPLKPCLLIDTLNTLESGIINACRAFNAHREHLMAAGGWKKIGFRIDSGDLAYLAAVCYNRMARELGTEDISVVLSNDLDENSIESILSQLFLAGEHKVIERLSFGLGTKGVTAWGEPALGGVCKMSEMGGSYILKISNNNSKTTIPGNLRSALITDEKGSYLTTLIYFKNEDPKNIKICFHPDDDSKFLHLDRQGYGVIQKQFPIYSSDGLQSRFIGKYASQSLNDIRLNSENTLKALDWSYKRLTNSHRAKVSLSPAVFEVRRKMIRGNIISLSE